MSFGTDTAIDTPAGYSADVPGGATGGAVAGGPQISPGGGASAPGGDPWYTQLHKMLQDPEVQKALGDAVKHLGNLSGSVQKMPPAMQNMMRQMLIGGGGGGVSGGTPSRGMGAGGKPFLGDMPDFSVQHAQDTLKSLGIPFG